MPKFLIAIIFWFVLLIIIVISLKFFVFPKKEQQRKGEILLNTSSETQFKELINLGLDSFEGYDPIRSKEFTNQLASNGIKLNIIDDQGNYLQRIKRLQNDELQFATFTVDALIKCSAEINDLPATIIAIIDESNGADAIKGFSDKFNDDLTFVATKNSPSETLAHIVISQFKLQNPKIQLVDNVDLVYNKAKVSNPNQNEAYILWEPYVSKLDKLHTILDTSSLSGYIYDVLVVNRNFLVSNKQTVEKVLEGYFKAVYVSKNNDKILLKNTQENYAHMGIDGALLPIETILSNVTSLLIKSKLILNDPTKGHPESLYYKDALATLKASNFHPGVKREEVRSVKLKELSTEEWDKLTLVGQLSVDSIIFPRGTTILTVQANETLNELRNNLNNWNRCYLIIQPVASTVGVLSINKELSLKRANIIKQYLIDNGIDAIRINVREPEINQSASTNFILAQPAY